MSAVVVEFRSVWKWYRRYGQWGFSLKDAVLRPRHAARQRRAQAESKPVLRDVDLVVHRGECVGIIGRNGIGKSTILGLVAGVLRPSRGEVIVRKRPCPMLELGAGFHPDLTSRENIILNGMTLGRSKKFMQSVVDPVIEFAQLPDLIDEPIRTYSTGMLARLGFSVLAHLDPELLLIDEVLAVGDVGFQERCLATFAAFRQRSVTMLFVSHNMREVRRVCDRVLWIDGAGIRRAGDPDEVTAAFEAEVLQSPKQDVTTLRSAVREAGRC